MKRTISLMISVLLIAALLAGCGGAPAAPAATEAPRTEPTAAPATEAPKATEAPAAAPSAAPAETAAPDEEKDETAEALAAYLDVLAANRAAILAYDWQAGLAYDENAYRQTPIAMPRPIVFADVWGDALPELIFLSAAGDESERSCADLHVFGYADGGARELYATEDTAFDALAGVGAQYRLFQAEEDKGLWIYTYIAGLGFTEAYTHLRTDGARAEADFCAEHSYDVTFGEDGAFTESDSWSLNGAEVAEEVFAAAIPDRDAQAAGMLMRNALWNEYDQVQPGEERWPMGTMLSYDDAVAELRGMLGVEPDETVDETLFFATLPENFLFASGVGGWSSEISIAPDGGFTGSFHDSNMGETGPGYPYGTVYVCAFEGRFGGVRRVDDYTYSMRLLELETESAEDTEYISDGVRYVASYPYGLENADEIMVYLPGSWLLTLPEDFVTWVAMPNAWGWNGERRVLLPFCGLYNVEGKEGWFSYDSSAVRVLWADDVRASFGDVDAVTAIAGDPAAHVLFYAREPVTDLRLYALELTELPEYGTPVFRAKSVYTQWTLSPERPLEAATVFYGDISNFGFSYVDAAGTRRCFAVELSGRDGSLGLVAAEFDEG